MAINGQEHSEAILYSLSERMVRQHTLCVTQGGCRGPCCKFGNLPLQSVPRINTSKTWRHESEGETCKILAALPHDYAVPLIGVCVGVAHVSIFAGWPSS